MAKSKSVKVVAKPMPFGPASKNKPASKPAKSGKGRGC